MEALRAAFEDARSLGTPLEQGLALRRFIEALEPGMAAGLLASLGLDELKGDAARQLFDHWATANPGEAVAWVQDLGDVETRRSFLTVAAMRWAVSDLKEAAAWARSLGEGASRSEIIAAVGAEAVRSDPLEAFLLGLELPAGATQAELLRRAAAEWAVKDRDGVLACVQQIQDRDLRQCMMEDVVVASAERDPVGAADLALKRMAPGAGQDRAVVSIIQRWVQMDPGQAAAWVREFPQCQLGCDAVDNLVTLWADRDMAASADWLLTLPLGELRNAGMLAYSRALERTDAEFSRKLATSVTLVQ